MRRLLPAVAILLLAASALAQETPSSGSDNQPSVDDNSTQGPVPAPLPPPLARPPLGLEGVDGSPVGRARIHMERAEVMDALGIRALRRAAAGSDCELLQAVRWEAGLALEAADVETRSAAAMLEPGSDEATAGATVRSRLAALEARLVDLGGELARIDELTRRGACEAPIQAPVWLPAEDRVPVAGATAVLVHTDGPGTVVWIDGAPHAISGRDGWAIAVVPVGLRRLCVAAAEEAACVDEVEIDAGMGAGFDLR